MNKKREVVLQYDDVMKLLKSHVADKAASFLGLTWKQEDPENIICLDACSIILPQEGLHFTIVDSPVDYK